MVYADEAGEVFNIAIMFMRWCDDDTLTNLDPLDIMIFAHSHAICFGGGIVLKLESDSGGIRQ